MIRTHKRNFSKSKLYLETEKEAWEKCHNLDCDPVIAEYQLKQLNEFSSKLSCVLKKNVLMNLNINTGLLLTWFDTSNLAMEIRCIHLS